MSISRSTRRAAAVAVMASGLVATLAFSSAATATVQTKYYSASAFAGTQGNTSIDAGVPTAITVTLQNSSTSTQSFGSAELTFGNLARSALSITQQPTASTWSASFASANSPVVKLTNSGTPVAPNKSVSVVVTVTALPPNFTIGTVVKQSNDFSGSPGNNFVHVSGNSDPTITVVPVNLAFTTEPPSLLQQTPPPNPTQQQYAEMCPVVQATSNGAPVQGVQVTLQPDLTAGNPGLTFGSGQPSTVATDGNGNAQFGDCKTGIGATNAGSGFKLQATSPSAGGPVDSTAFTVTPNYCVTQCIVTGTGKDGTSVTETANGVTFGLTDAFVGTTLSLKCDSQVATVAADPFDTTATSSDPVTGTISLTFPKAVVNSVPDNGAPHMPVCAGATTSFPGSARVTPAQASNPYIYQGLLLDCTDPVYLQDIANTALYPLQMCVQSRAKLAGAKETVVIYSNSLSDPMAW